MQAIPQPTTMQIPPHQQFRLCVFPLDAGHHPATGGRINNVNHQPSSIQLEAKCIHEDRVGGFNHLVVPQILIQFVQQEA